ncbi:MAG: glycosyltransferase family 4 protein [Thermoguttaceae bacterium]
MKNNSLQSVDHAMNLLYISTTSSSCGFLNGQLSFMRQRGFNVGVCCSPGKELDEITRNENAEAFPIFMQREIAPIQDIISLWKLVRLMRRFKPQVVIAGTPKASLLGMIAAFITRVPVRIFINHGLRMETLGGFNRGIMTLTDRLTNRLATRTFCVSQSLRDKCVQLRLVSPSKARVIHHGSCNGIDSRNYSCNAAILGEANRLRNELNIQVGERVLCFVGRIVKDKGIPELADAFRMIKLQYPQTHLIIVGPEESGDPVPDDTLSFLRAEESIHLVGYANPVPYFALSDIFVLPTYREGLPGVALEAAAMGIPVVGTKATGVVDAVVDGVTGTLVPIGDSSALAKALCDYLGDPSKRLQHGLSARTRVVRDFQPESIWQAYYEDIVSLLRKKGLSIPESMPIEENQKIDLCLDEQITREWLAKREVIFNGGETNLETVTN